jgi:DNA-directed RNA polymerase specialized sigma24 family protein
MGEKTRTRIGGPEDPREGLEAVVALRRTLEALEAAQVENAFVAGWSWAQIAEVLGVSKQAVHKKHAKRIRAKYPGEPPPRRKGRDA